MTWRYIVLLGMLLPLACSSKHEQIESRIQRCWKNVEITSNLIKVKNADFIYLTEGPAIFLSPLCRGLRMQAIDTSAPVQSFFNEIVIKRVIKGGTIGLRADIKFKTTDNINERVIEINLIELSNVHELDDNLSEEIFNKFGTRSY